MNTRTSRQPLGKDILAKITQTHQVDLGGNPPRSSAAFLRMQQHAVDHPSMEYSNDESLLNALAGSFTDDGYARLNRYAKNNLKGTKYDQSRLRNFALNDTSLPEYHPEFTRIRSSRGESNTDVSDAPTTPKTQTVSVAKNATAGNAVGKSIGPTLVRMDRLLTPAGLLRQRQINELDRRAYDANRAVPIEVIDVDEDDGGDVLVIAKPKSTLAQSLSDSFHPDTCSTPVQPSTPRRFLMPKNSAIGRPTATPLTKATAPTPVAPNLSALPTATPMQVTTSAGIAPKSPGPPSRIPQWVSAKKAAAAKSAIATTTTPAPRPSVDVNVTPRSTAALPAIIISHPNSPKRPPVIPEVVHPNPKSMTPASAPIVTFNLTVNNTPAARSIPQTTQPLPTPRSMSGGPVNSNRVSSTVSTSHHTLNEPLQEIVVTDDEDEDDDQVAMARQTPVWKSVENRNATPGIPLIDNRRSAHGATNKSLCRQLFQSINENLSRSMNDENGQLTGPVAAEIHLNVTTVTSHSVRRTKPSDKFITHTINTSDRPTSQTYDKERPSLQNFTYDVSNPVGDGRTMQPAVAQNACASQSEEIQSSQSPQVPIPNHDGCTGAVPNGGNDSSTTASSTTSNIENFPRIVNVRSLHQSNDKTMHSSQVPNQRPNTSVTLKAAESVAIGGQTPSRTSNRLALGPLPSVNNHTIRLSSKPASTSTTDLDSGPISCILQAPTFFRDDQIIEEHSPTVVRESIQQIISSQKNKSPHPLSLTNRPRARTRRRNRPKTSDVATIDNLTDDDDSFPHSQNGRRTLYTKGNSDCEENHAISNDTRTTNAQLPTLPESQATQTGANQTHTPVAKTTRQTADPNRNKTISFRADSVSASSTVIGPEPATVTMSKPTLSLVSDISGKPAVDKKTKTAQKAKETKTKTKPKTTQKEKKGKESERKGKDDSAKSTEGLRRSTRPKCVAVCAKSAYDLALLNVIRKRGISPGNMNESQPDDGIANKKRRIEPTKKVPKTKVDGTVDTVNNPRSKKPNKSKAHSAHEAEAVDQAAERLTVDKSRGKKPNKSKAHSVPEVDADERAAERHNILQVAAQTGWFNDLYDPKAKLPILVSQEGVYKIRTNLQNTIQIASTSFDQVHYFSANKIDYGFFPCVTRTSGIMRFHEGAVKPTSTTGNYMEMEVLHGRFELYQERKSITISPGVVFMKPGTSYRIKYLGKGIGVILFNIFDENQ